MFGMKTFLTLFVLLFSSSVFAEDDLIGKKLFCMKYINNNDELILRGFEFISSTELEYHSHSSSRIKYYLSKRAYKTSTSKIYVMRGTSTDLKNIEDYIIDRRNLLVARVIDSNHNFAVDDCMVATDDLKKMINYALQEEKNKNKL